MARSERNLSKEQSLGVILIKGAFFHNDSWASMLFRTECLDWNKEIDGKIHGVDAHVKRHAWYYKK